MCFSATVASLIATGIGAVGNIMQGNAAADAADAQAAQLETNAKIAENQARDAVIRGAEEEEQLRIRAAQLKGRQRTGFAAAGIDLESGSAADAWFSTLYEEELDIAVIRNNAQREKWANIVQSQDALNQAAMARAAGKNAKKAGYLGAGASIIGGASLVADKWDWTKRAKTPSITYKGVPTSSIYQNYGI